jgi:hypothetical protein
MGSIRENLESLKVRIAQAARRAGRDPQGVRLVCVTKGVAVERIQEAIAAGVTEIGENRVQEAQEKQPALGRGVRWHMVGTLQRNKAKLAVELFDLTHSVDSAELVEVLESKPGTVPSGDSPRPKLLEVLIQVNVSGEATKHGCRPEEAEPLAQAIAKSKHLKLAGLMTMAPFSESPEDARPYFRKLRELRDRLQKGFYSKLRTHDSELHLSMGMSGDFEVAVEEGATMVRIGTAIFGGQG